jgi:DmsE family decaheme c-type cytochrome
MRTFTISIQRLICEALMLVCLGLAAVAPTSAKDCLTCHKEDPAVLASSTRAHGETSDGRLPIGGAMCETCHGVSTSHSDSGGKLPPDQAFGEADVLSAIARSDTCLGCHAGGHQKNWAMSEHATSDIACDGCHKVHSPSDPVQSRLNQSQVCLTCHSALKADTMKFSRHPVAEGIVACTDCHNPHGGKGPAMLVEATINETCYQCHTEKRGPFLWEHEPVQDDCTNCHTPHGSVNDNLLVIRQPLLCQQCHVSTSHRGTNYVKGTFSSGNANFYGKACLNCHGEIHGTNHAQGGAYFE